MKRFSGRWFRFLSSLLAVCLLVFLLTSCGSDGNSGGDSVSSDPSSTAAPSQTETAATTAATLPTQRDVSGEQTQTVGSVLVVGDTGYEYYNFVRSTADQYAALVSRAGSLLQGVSTVYAMVVPTGIDIVLQDSVRAGLPSSDQEEAIRYMYGSMSGVTTVDLYDVLQSHRDEYLYFRTDHHWTALGAYYGYAQFAEAKGVEPVALDRYTVKEFPDFLGAFYSDTGKAPPWPRIPTPSPPTCRSTTRPLCSQTGTARKPVGASSPTCPAGPPPPSTTPSSAGTILTPTSSTTIWTTAPPAW